MELLNINLLIFDLFLKLCNIMLSSFVRTFLVVTLSENRGHVIFQISKLVLQTILYFEISKTTFFLQSLNDN